MLYQIYETQRSIMEPFSDLAEVAAKLFSNPGLPLGQFPLAQRVSAAYDLMHRLGKDYEKPVFGIHTVDVDGTDVAIHERIEMNKPFCELRRFKRFTDDAATLDKLKGQPVVLVVAPLSGHYATLLRDTVKTMLKDHKVYITDWRNARLVPVSEGEFHLDDYVNYVQEFIRYLQDKYDNCHVMSVCQPTVPVLAAVSLMASRGETTPLSMTMMGGPIDARKSPTAVNDLAVQRSHSWFENNVIYRVPDSFPGAGRRVYPGFLQHTGFIAMNPNRHADSHYDYFQDLIKGDDSSTESHRKFYDEYNAVLDMDADYYLETIDTVFQDFKLVNGTWDVKNPKGKPERVKPQDITHTALLTIEGELDDISGSGQTAAAHDLCSGITPKQKMHYETAGAGHYGIFSGRRWREMVYPLVKAFIVAHQPRATPAPQGTAKPKTAAATQAKAPATVAPVKVAQAKAKAKPVQATTVKAAVAKKPAVKAPAAKAVKAAVAAKPAAVAKPASKPAAKPVAKTAAKPAAKPAVVAVAPQAKAAAAPAGVQAAAPASPAVVAKAVAPAAPAVVVSKPDQTPNA